MSEQALHHWVWQDNLTNQTYYELQRVQRIGEKMEHDKNRLVGKLDMLTKELQNSKSKIKDTTHEKDVQDKKTGWGLFWGSL